MTYSLYDKFGRGDSGPMSMCFLPDGEVVCTPVVGGHMRVGSHCARLYSVQDYWTTSEIVEILEEHTDTVVFKTRTGSVYTWTEF